MVRVFVTCKTLTLTYIHCIYYKEKRHPVLPECHAFLSGALEATRTPDPQLRRLLLYPAELRGHEHYNNVILQFYQFNF